MHHGMVTSHFAPRERGFIVGLHRRGERAMPIRSCIAPLTHLTGAGARAMAFFKRRRTTAATPYLWKDGAAPLMDAPLPPVVLPAPTPEMDLTPLGRMFFDSVLFAGAKLYLFFAIALSTALFALDKNLDLILRSNLWLLVVVSAVAGMTGLFQTLALNVKAVRAIVKAWRAVDATAVDAFAPTLPTAKRVIDLIPNNTRATQDVIHSGNVAIDKRDFLQFIHRAWATNGEEEKGTARIYWCGGTRKAGNNVPPFIFVREDGTQQRCTRAYYDAIMSKLTSIGEIESRAPGSSGVLRRDPSSWIATATWL